MSLKVRSMPGGHSHIVAKEIARYYYECGHQLCIYVKNRRIYILDETNRYPVCPEHGARVPYPGHGTEDVEFDYVTLGLYYEYDMGELGWGKGT